MISSLFNKPFNFGHAVVISFVVHFGFLLTHPFQFANKPLIPEKKYKKFRLEVIKRPQISPKIKKQLKI